MRFTGKVWADDRKSPATGLSPFGKVSGLLQGEAGQTAQDNSLAGIQANAL